MYTYFRKMMVGLLPLVAVSPFAVNASDIAEQFDDWHNAKPSEWLCRGYYFEPNFPYDYNQPYHEFPIILQADKTRITGDGQSILDNHVALQQGNRFMTADSASFYRDEATESIEEIDITGHVSFKEPGLRLDGSNAKIWPPEDKKQITDSQFRLYSRHARGQADTITVQGNDHITLNQARYTTCGPHHKTWHIRANQVELYRDTGRGEAYNATLYFKKTPIFYTPYASFPIDNKRKSGFLYPSFGSSLRSGTEFSLPYYWNIAPNYDYTLTPKVMSKRGVEFQNEFRYLFSGGSGSIKAAVLPDDRAYRHFKSDKLNHHPGFSNTDPRVRSLDKKSNHRFAMNVNHTQNFSKHWLFNLDYQYVKDPNYFMDLGNSLGATSTTQLLQLGQLDYEGNWAQGLLKVQRYQTLYPFDGPMGTAVYEYAPQAAFKTYAFYLPYGLKAKMRGSWSHFIHKDDPFTGEVFTVGDRFNLRPSLGMPFVTPGWFFKPQIELDMTQYQLKLGDTDRTNRKPNSPFRFIPISSIDTGLVFERPVTIGSHHFYQTLEPRLYYLNVPYTDQNHLPNFDSSRMGFDFNQLFRESQFSSIDRVQDTHQISIAFTSKLLDKTSFAQQFYVSVGQSFYFRDRDVTLCDASLDGQCKVTEDRYSKRHSSLIAGQLGVDFSNAINGSTQVLWDPYKKHVDSGSVTFKYQPNFLDVANISYQFSRNNSQNRYERLHQVDTSFAKRLTPHWRAVMRYNYNLSFKKTNHLWGGLERQSCCFAVRLLATRFALPTSHPSIKEYDNAFYIQFVFKGLSSFGDNNLTSIIQEGISGYDWLDGVH